MNALLVILLCNFLMFLNAQRVMNMNCTILSTDTCTQSGCGVGLGSSCIYGDVPFCIPDCNDTTYEQGCYRITNGISYYSLTPRCNSSLMELGWTRVDDINCNCNPPVSPLLMFQRIVALIVMVIVAIFLIYPVKIPLTGLLKKCHCVSESSKKKYSFPLDFSTVPVLGVFLLLACGTIAPIDCLVGIVGNDKIKPYTIIIMFFSVAYICISFDITGIFDFVSLHCVNATAGSPTKLFMAIGALSTILAIITSNDIVILCLTPIICALSSFTGMDARPLLFVQFFSANIASALLLIGNPTNIIVALANKITFVEFSKWTAIPVCCSLITTQVLLYLLFRKEINGTTINAKAANQKKPREYLRDIPGAIYGGTCLLTCLCCLASSNMIQNFPIWGIPLIFACLMAIKDISFDFMPCYPRKKKAIQPDVVVSNVSMAMKAGEGAKDDKKDTREMEAVASSDSEDGDNNTKKEKQHDHHKHEETSAPPAKTETAAPQPKEQPQIAKVVLRLPLKIIFFVFGVFIIVEALQVSNWIALIAGALAKAIGPGNSSSNIAAAVFLMGYVSIIACNILNNQPMAILFTTILQDEHFNVSPRAHKGAMFAVIFAANLGANVTLVGALAGIMWAAIRKSRNMEIRFVDFLKVGICVTPIAFGIGLAVITGEALTY